MSVNRNRGGKKAYLKHNVSRHDPKPVGTLRDVIGLGKDINPVVALPHRAIEWFDKNKHTPTMTEPMKERVESWRVAVREQHYISNEHVIMCINTPLRQITMHYNGFSDRAVYYFKEIDRISGVERESFTISKTTAQRIRDNQLKGIPWKEV